MANTYAVNPGWRLILSDLGLDALAVLRRAGLPDDLLSREKASLTTAEYFGLWRAMAAESSDPLFPLRLGSSIPAEAFDPPIFAALSSPDLNTALRRLAHYKRLIGPMVLTVDQTPRHTEVTLAWLDDRLPPPVELVAAELVFFVQLGRLATRSEICPLRVSAPTPPTPMAAYQAYFGTSITAGDAPAIRFTAQDAAAPFLTANEKMWSFFEADLGRRLAQLDQQASVSERTRAVLLELLPSGASSIDAVCRRLGTSSRTLQRRLRGEGLSFQQLLNSTREDLARHYLTNSRLSGAEIAFLLGFDDPNSFFRAFHSWTGATPETVRHAGAGQA